MSLKRSFSIFLILAVGLGVAAFLITSAPKPQKKVVEKVKPLVEVSELVAGNYRPTLETGGNVSAKPSVKLMAQVTGQVVEINPQASPGAWLKQGAILGKIDDANYQLVAQQKQAALTQAQADLDIELGQQKNAWNNYKLSGLTLDETAKALALREPQLAAAKATVNIAHAELKKAQLDLQRTALRMPFDGHVLAMSLTEGAFVSAGTQVFELVDSAEFWLQVKIPQNFVGILDLEHSVTISKPEQWGSDVRQGKVKHILPAVDSADRQVRVLISIEQPLHQAFPQTQVRYNDYVNVTLFGRQLENVYAFSSDVLASNDTLWVVDKNDTLQLRKVSTVYKGRHQVWANLDVQPGDQRLMSRLQIASVGMPVRIEASSNRAADEASL